RERARHAALHLNADFVCRFSHDRREERGFSAGSTGRPPGGSGTNGVPARPARREPDVSRLVEECGRTARRTLDRGAEEVEGVVGADHIMELLRFDAVGQIDLGVENPLVPAERVSQGRASRVEHYRDPPGRLLQDAYRPPAEGRFDGVPERSVEARRGPTLKTF